MNKKVEKTSPDFKGRFLYDENCLVTVALAKIMLKCSHNSEKIEFDYIEASSRIKVDFFCVYLLVI